MNKREQKKVALAAPVVEKSRAVRKLSSKTRKIWNNADELLTLMGYYSYLDGSVRESTSRDRPEPLAALTPNERQELAKLADKIKEATYDINHIVFKVLDDEGRR